MHDQMQWVLMQESDITLALVQLFRAFAQQAQGQGHLETEVDPTPLREALSQLPGSKFGVGEHPNAAPCVLLLYAQAIALGSITFHGCLQEHAFHMAWHMAVYSQSLSLWQQVDTDKVLAQALS